VHIAVLSASLLISPPLFLASPAVAFEGKTWSISKIEKVRKRATIAADKKKWSLAIRYNEQVLTALKSRAMQDSALYIQALIQGADYYAQAGRVAEADAHAAEAYDRAEASLGGAHEITRAARASHYRQLVAKQDYSAALVLVEEAVAALGTTVDDDYRRHRYLKHLYSLYGLTGQLAREAETLEVFVRLDRQLYGNTALDQAKVLQNLANSYCLQGKLEEFESLQPLLPGDFVCR
jgi:hypothetical protein